MEGPKLAQPGILRKDRPQAPSSGPFNLLSHKFDMRSTGVSGLFEVMRQLQGWKDQSLVVL